MLSFSSIFFSESIFCIKSVNSFSNLIFFVSSLEISFSNVLIFFSILPVSVLNDAIFSFLPITKPLPVPGFFNIKVLLYETPLRSANIHPDILGSKIALLKSLTINVLPSNNSAKGLNWSLAFIRSLALPIIKSLSGIGDNLIRSI